MLRQVDKIHVEKFIQSPRTKKKRTIVNLRTSIATTSWLGGIRNYRIKVKTKEERERKERMAKRQTKNRERQRKRKLSWLPEGRDWTREKLVQDRQWHLGSCEASVPIDRDRMNVKRQGCPHSPKVASIQMCSFGDTVGHLCKHHQKFLARFEADCLSSAVFLLNSVFRNLFVMLLLSWGGSEGRAKLHGGKWLED